MLSEKKSAFKVINITKKNLLNEEDISKILQQDSLKKNQNLVLNFEKVKHINSRALYGLGKYKDILNNNGIELVLVSNESNLLDLFSSSNISQIFQVCNTLTEAIEELDLIEF